MRFDLGAVARAMGARMGPGDVREETLVEGWSVDTRTQNVGDLFFALRGENGDGHRHAARALANGAVAAVVDHPAGAARELVVDDTLAALGRVAAWARRQWGGNVIGVTGSAGKTTTKDAIAHLLATEIAAGKTEGNFNNHIGVPLSILRLPEACRVAVLEMGMNHAGEIRALAALARPETGVVTNVGWAHAECLGSIEGVALAKRELIEALPANGTAVLNADDPRVLAFRGAFPGSVITFGFSEAADVRAGDLRFDAGLARFRVDGVEFSSPLAGRHGVLNILAALGVARVFGIPASHLREAVRTFSPGSMRGERLERGGITIWNDCYNANPEAMRAMIDVLAGTPAARRFAVLGEMLELGQATERLHRETGRYAAQCGIHFLAGVGGAARHMIAEARDAGMDGGAARFFEDPAAAGEWVQQAARPGDAVLFKGSRGVRMERALERFLTRDALLPAL
jgi:UDP-N-acetylmuramoyl-tripeptide--D-alanyl-D-alanine ligase